MLRCCDQAINIPWTLYKSKSLFVVPKKTVGRATTTMVPPGARRSASIQYPVHHHHPPPPLFSLFSFLLLNALCVPFWARRAARWALNVRGRLKHADTRKLVACAWRVSSVSLSISPRPPSRLRGLLIFLNCIHYMTQAFYTFGAHCHCTYATCDMYMQRLQWQWNVFLHMHDRGRHR